MHFATIMRIALVTLLFAPLVVWPGCGKPKFAGPQQVLANWSRSIQDLNYAEYSRCEAYPRGADVFAEMYRDFYFTDMMVTSIEEPSESDVKTDYEGNAYIHCSLSFEAGVIKRGAAHPSQLARGDAVFIKFAEGKRAKQGWLMSNRTFITVDR
ncbi:MAG: hypothetical protein EPN93_15170 [Spirochaetes bacterium]|nr:MAG: hypothetical protein EPN93_15170 [Spirochaetota bacterium]